MEMNLKNKDFIEHSSGLFVSNDGEIYVPSNGARKEHFTFGSLINNGYLRVGRNGKQYQVHRLVAECFIPNPDNLPTVDHIDRNPKNNRVENLRWASRLLQTQNRGKYTRPNAPKNDAKSKKVLQLTLDGELVKEWPSTNECDRNGYHKGCVSSCCRGEYKQYKGFMWRYED